MTSPSNNNNEYFLPAERSALLRGKVISAGDDSSTTTGIHEADLGILGGLFSDGTSHDGAHPSNIRDLNVPEFASSVERGLNTGGTCDFYNNLCAPGHYCYQFFGQYQC